MKPLIGCALLCIGMLASASQAQTIYKCVVNGATIFQQEPCSTPAGPVGHSVPLPANSPLVGTWRSDHDLTMAYLRQHTTMTKKQDAFLDQLIGHMTLTFSRDHVKSDMPDLDLEIDGKPFPSKGFHGNDPYVVVSASPQKVSISSADPVTGGASISDYNFDNHDTMWARMDSQGRTALDPRSREYFRRVK